MAGEAGRIEYAAVGCVCTLIEDCTSIEDAGRQSDAKFGLLERNDVGATR